MLSLHQLLIIATPNPNLITFFAFRRTTIIDSSQHHHENYIFKAVRDRCSSISSHPTTSFAADDPRVVHPSRDRQSSSLFHSQFLTVAGCHFASACVVHVHYHHCHCLRSRHIVRHIHIKNESFFLLHKNPADQSN